MHGTKGPRQFTIQDYFPMIIVNERAHFTHERRTPSLQEVNSSDKKNIRQKHCEIRVT